VDGVGIWDLIWNMAYGLFNYAWMTVWRLIGVIFMSKVITCGYYEVLGENQLLYQQVPSIRVYSSYEIEQLSIYPTLTPYIFISRASTHLWLYRSHAVETIV
jgi:hypothetical protein